MKCGSRNWEKIFYLVSIIPFINSEVYLVPCHSNVCDADFLRKWLTPKRRYLFSPKSFIKEVWESSKYALLVRTFIFFSFLTRIYWLGKILLSFTFLKISQNSYDNTCQSLRLRPERGLLWICENFFIKTSFLQKPI